MSSVLTDRQQREREFFDEYWSRYQDHAQLNLDVIAGNERRPWNPYWYIFEAAKKQYEGGARELLDFGCGAGINAVSFALMGFQVSGFDISPRCITTAKQLAAAHGVSDRIHFSIQVSENLQYPNDSFDIVVGVDILHHVEIAASVKECLRVLRPGGVAYFREFVEVPAFDRVRNTSLVRLFFPNRKNLDRNRYSSEDERKMTDQDIATIHELCHSVVERRFYVFARLNRLIRQPGDRSASFIEQVDYWLCKKIPALSKLGGSVVLECMGKESTKVGFV